MAKRIRITAYYEFNLGEGENVEWWTDDENEPDVFEALQMAHAMGISREDEHKPKIGFVVQEMEHDEDGYYPNKNLKEVINGG